jgi:O-antigen ligase
MVFRRQTGSSYRFAAEGFDANDLAAALALALPMAWYLGSVHSQPLLRWLCRAYVPVGLVAIGLTGSRGGMLATIVALLIIPLTMTRLSPGRLVTGIAVLLISGAVAVAYIPETTVQRLATTSSDVQQGHLGGRLKIWVAGVHAFAQRPMFGHGTAGFRTAIGPFLPANPQVAHNSFLSVLVENGILGLALYGLMFIAVLRAVLKLGPLDRRFSLVLLATLGVVMIPLTWEDQKPVWFILAALIGLARARETMTSGHVWPQARVAHNVPAASAGRRMQPIQALRSQRNRGAAS